ncbi:hypothetical protein TREES_T100017971 [Tupaia chinensis]|uniref:Uncharacterized protein n=1 Tax=Tupaia chinensis TaxID=246437 RepID=L9JQH9_TUPCH|nr:hypothetical protein TREES_T100017971 [Tupaia chinensis]
MAPHHPRLKTITQTKMDGETGSKIAEFILEIEASPFCVLPTSRSVPNDASVLLSVRGLVSYHTLSLCHNLMALPLKDKVLLPCGAVLWSCQLLLCIPTGIPLLLSPLFLSRPAEALVALMGRSELLHLLVDRFSPGLMTTAVVDKRDLSHYLQETSSLLS